MKCVLKNYNAGGNIIFALQYRISKGDHIMKETRIRIVVKADFLRPLYA